MEIPTELTEFQFQTYVEPHLRGYRQTAADFFTMSLAPAAVPATGTTDVYASGDYRLGALTDTTCGARLGW